jgi:hypothetical protein
LGKVGSCMTQSLKANIGEAADPCNIPVEDVEYLGKFPTTRSLLNALRSKYLNEEEKNSGWTSTERLKQDLETLETEYNSIPVYVKTYKDAYDGFKTQLGTLKAYESKLYSMINDDKYQGIRQAIDDLWKSPGYSEDRYRQTYQQAWNSTRGIKSCLGKAEVEVSTTPASQPAPTPTPKAGSKDGSTSSVALKPAQKVLGAKESFSNYKSYKEMVVSLLNGLQDFIKKEIDPVDDRDIRKKYAYYLLLKDYLDPIRNLSPDDYDQQKPGAARTPKKTVQDEQWLKDQLMDSFKKWVYRVYEYFYWNRDTVSKDRALQIAWMKYDKFMSDRQMQFISEAEEVPLTADMEGCP